MGFESESDSQFHGALAMLRNVYGSYTQTVALRFTGLIIPRNALITSARLIFVSDEIQPSSENVTLRISAALTAHAPTFDCSNVDGVGRSEGISCSTSLNWITARLGDEGNGWDGPDPQAVRPRGRTAEYVEWSPGAWNQPRSKEATPNLGLIIQELVNQHDWSAGNSVALVIERVRGDGTRRAMAGSARGNPP